MHVIQSFSETFSEFFFLDIYFCPKKKSWCTLWKNACLLTIIEIYRLDTKKINFIL